MAQFFTVNQVQDRWWFRTPEGSPFWSIGMNHIDSATLRYPENGTLWRDRYGRSEERWLRGKVAPDLRTWGFNTIGWAQEVIIRTETIHRHSRAWPHEAYTWAGMPYCHLLPFTEAHQWEVETRLPNVFSEDFEQWCDTVAREHCAQMADDPNLIGYFYCDCPTWVHTRPNNATGPWFDPARLSSASGRDKLTRMAERYYQVTHDAIRRYDPNHLILGDRYEGKALLPDEILLAAAPYVDVLSYQDFSEPSQIAEDFHRWGELTAKPVLLADACAPKRDSTRYREMIETLRDVDDCVGWHVCGAYLRNRTRDAGFLEEDETPTDVVEPATEANRETLGWVQRQ